MRDAPVSRTRRPVGAFRGGSVSFPCLASLALSRLNLPWLARYRAVAALTDIVYADRIIGFLLGLTAVGGYGYLRVLEDYRQASERLLVSVEELKGSTEQVR